MLKPPFVIIIPGDGAVCPATTRSGCVTRRSDASEIRPDTSNTHTLGNVCTTQSRNVPAPLSAKEVTLSTLKSFCADAVGVAVGVETVGIAVKVGVAVAVGGTTVGVLVGLGVGVSVGITSVGVNVGVLVDVLVGVGVFVHVGVAVGGTGVAVGVAPPEPASLVNEKT